VQHLSKARVSLADALRSNIEAGDARGISVSPVACAESESTQVLVGWDHT
jgi:hypothetical protein